MPVYIFIFISILVPFENAHLCVTTSQYMCKVRNILMLLVLEFVVQSNLFLIDTYTE